MTATTYTTKDGWVWDLGEEFTANGFHYRWDGMPYGDRSPLMLGVGRPEMAMRLEALAMLRAFDDADFAESRPHVADPTECPTCRAYNGLAPLPARVPGEALALLPAAEDTVEMRTVEVAR